MFALKRVFILFARPLVGVEVAEMTWVAIECIFSGKGHQAAIAAKLAGERRLERIAAELDRKRAGL